jgi:hypothetical protein
MRVAEFEDFKDPDVFSPHMDLVELRKIYAEWKSEEEEYSTPHVVASRPERAARDLAKHFLVAADAKYEIRIEERTRHHFVLRYRKSWKQLNEQPWSAPTRIRRDLVQFAGEPHTTDVDEYTTVQIPSFAQERVFVQFYRLEPSFQFYEYAAVLLQTEARQLRLPGWGGESIPFEHKILVKSMFRPFLIKQGQNEFVQSANSIRDAFAKAQTKLNNGRAKITITDVFDRHRYVNEDGAVEYKFRKAPVIGEFKRRADSKRRRTHCIEKTFLFEKGPVRHVLHTSFMDENIFQRELQRKLKNSILKFLRMARTSRLDDAQKIATTSDMLKNRWFLVACAALSNDPDVNAMLVRAFDALHSRNPAVPRTVVDHDEYSFELLTGLLEDFDADADEIPYEEFTHEVAAEDLVRTLEERNLPIPPSVGCEGNSTIQTVRGNVMNVTEGHDAFPTEFLSGSVTRSFGDFQTHQTNYTRDFILDTYTKNIRDDLKRVVKRNNDAFIQYLEHIHPQQIMLAFGKSPSVQSRNSSIYEKIIQVLFSWW